MIDQKSTYKQKPVRKIFLAGLPAYVDLSLVLDFFQQFGYLRIGHHESPEEEQASHAKGHCILICNDPKTAASIVEAKHFTFMGRTLTAMPLRSGKQLIIENSRLNNSRVILKKISKEIPADLVKSLLETNYGPLKTLFKFVPDETKINIDEGKARLYRNFDSYSAIFENKSDAKALIQDAFLHLPNGSVATAEKFRVKKKNSPSFVNPSRPGPFGFGNKLNSHGSFNGYSHTNASKSSLHFFNLEGQRQPRVHMGFPTRTTIGKASNPDSWSTEEHPSENFRFNKESVTAHLARLAKLPNREPLPL